MIDPDKIAQWVSVAFLASLTVLALAIDTAAVIGLYNWLLPQ